MTDKDQVRPLAPATILPVSDETTSDNNNNNKNNLRRRKNRIRCLICVSVTFLILLIIALTLAFTVFKVKDPIIKMNGVTINGLDLTLGGGGSQIGRLGANLSMTVDISVKNPNSVSFKYSNTTTDVTYRGTVFGEARGPPGKAEAHRTARMNMTVVFMADRLLLDPGLGRDVIGSGLVNVGSYTKVSGKVTIMGFVKKHVTVKMNCNMALNVTSQGIQDMVCKRKVDL